MSQRHAELFSLFNLIFISMLNLVDFYYSVIQIPHLFFWILPLAY